MAPKERAVKERYILKPDKRKYYPVLSKSVLLAAIARARKGYRWRGKDKGEVFTPLFFISMKNLIEIEEKNGGGGEREKHKIIP